MGKIGAIKTLDGFFYQSFHGFYNFDFLVLNI
jgi:hypothetical protein